MRRSPASRGRSGRLATPTVLVALALASAPVVLAACDEATPSPQAAAGSGGTSSTGAGGAAAGGSGGGVAGSGSGLAGSGGGMVIDGDGCLDPFTQGFLVPMAPADGVGVTLPLVTDGTALFYGEQGHHLRRVDLATGASAVIFEAPEASWGSGLFWQRENDLVVYTDGKLSALPKAGGTPTALGTVSGFPVTIAIAGDSAYLFYRRTFSPPYQLEYVRKNLLTGVDASFHQTEVPDQPSNDLVVTDEGLFVVRGKELTKIAFAGGESAVDLGFAPDQLFLSKQDGRDGNVYAAAIVANTSGTSFLPRRRFGRVAATGGLFEAGFEDDSAPLGAGLVARAGTLVGQLSVNRLYRWNDGENAAQLACFQTETSVGNGVTYHGFALVGRTAYIGVRQGKDGLTRNGIMRFEIP